MDANKKYLTIVESIEMFLKELEGSKNPMTLDIAGLMKGVQELKKFFTMVEIQSDMENLPELDELPVMSDNESEEDMLGQFFSTIFGEKSFDEKRRIESELIDVWWPGSESLTDEEVLKQKFYPSLHLYQFVVSLKRYVEVTGDGWVTPIEHGWSFGHARSL